MRIVSPAQRAGPHRAIARWGAPKRCAAEPGPISLRRHPEVLARRHHQPTRSQVSLQGKNSHGADIAERPSLTLAV
jgi:hypothetical protein